MSQVYIVKDDTNKCLPVTWALYRVGSGPFRCEGQGFKTISEARAFAKTWKHEIVTLTAKDIRR